MEPPENVWVAIVCSVPDRFTPPAPLETKSEIPVKFAPANSTRSLKLRVRSRPPPEKPTCSSVAPDSDVVPVKVTAPPYVWSPLVEIVPRALVVPVTLRFCNPANPIVTKLPFTVRLWLLPATEPSIPKVAVVALRVVSPTSEIVGTLYCWIPVVVMGPVSETLPAVENVVTRRASSPAILLPSNATEPLDERTMSRSCPFPMTSCPKLTAPPEVRNPVVFSVTLPE